MPDRRWPTARDYEDALLVGAVEDPDLRSREVGRKPNYGPPLGRYGNAGVVYRYSGAGESLAVKLFRTNRSDLRERQMYISTFLKQPEVIEANCFVAMRYLDRGVQIRDSWYPAVVMGWSAGTQLDSYASAAANNSSLARLPAAWLGLLSTLRRLDVIHGDLQHGNVLVEADGGMRLIDYDGMLVPTMPAGFQSLERGHNAYQHPLVWRSDGADLPVRLREDFSAVVMLVNLLAYAQRLLPGPDTDLDNGDFGLSVQDLAAPESSQLLQRLAHTPAQTGAVAALLLRAIQDVSFSTNALHEAAAAVGGQISGAPKNDRNVTPLSADIDRQINEDLKQGRSVFQVAHSVGVSEAIVRARLSALERRIPLPPSTSTPPQKPTPTSGGAERNAPPRQRRTVPALTEEQRQVLIAVRSYGSYTAAAAHIPMDRRAVGLTMRTIRERLEVATDSEAVAMAEQKKVIPPAPQSVRTTPSTPREPLKPSEASSSTLSSTSSNGVSKSPGSSLSATAAVLIGIATFVVVFVLLSLLTSL